MKTAGHTSDQGVIFETKALNVFYGEFRAVRDIDLQVRANEITALIGPSGCGKSTVLRTLNRMNDLIPNARVEGVVRYNGEDLYDPDVDPVEVRRRIGMVFQKPNPFPKSIFENVAYGLRLRGLKNRGELEARVEAALRAAALWDDVKDRLKKNAYNLSGGQQQRLCIARALAVDPELLLFDEPTSALDPLATSRIEELIGELQQRVTILIVTHNMHQAMRVSTFTAFLYLGELVEFAPTHRLFNAPRHELTNEYITGRFG